MVHGHSAKKSANPVDRDILVRLVAARAPGLHGLRDAALIETAFATDGTIRVLLRETKTHKETAPPPLLLTGRAATALDLWLRASGVKDGAVFRALTRPDRRGAARRRCSTAG